MKEGAQVAEEIVRLEGGPADLPVDRTAYRVAPGDQKVKIMHNGGYEHFERVEGESSPVDGTAVFRWTFRTKVCD